MIKRLIADEVRANMLEFKAICITGPRQSGKTTLAKKCFPNLPYISLEDPDIALSAQDNGRLFLEKYKEGAILDEVQRVPELFRYLQTHLDKYKRNGQFVLSGSNNFLLQNNISQTLAGRVAYIELLPCSLQEVLSVRKTWTIDDIIFNGAYPSIVANLSSSSRWIPNYIKTYLDRDVRLLRNIGNMRQFQQFVFLCAARAGQILNIQSLALEVKVDHKTIQAWLSVLESSYIIHLLQPYHSNFNKRVIKSPKIYFYDTGLLCYLLSIKSVSTLKRHSGYGHIFENFIITEILKNRSNKLQDGNVYYFRDSAGNELDAIIDKDGSILPIEIKSTKKYDTTLFKNIKWWQKLARNEGGILIYQGVDKDISEFNIQALNWHNVTEI